MESKELVRIDCLGDMCPIPIMKLQQQEKELSRGRQVMLVTDHSCVSQSVKSYCDARGYQVSILEPINGVWEFYINI